MLVDRGGRTGSLRVKQEQCTALLTSHPSKTAADHGQCIVVEPTAIEGQRSFRRQQQLRTITLRASLHRMKAPRELGLSAITEFLARGNRRLPQSQRHGFPQRLPRGSAVERQRPEGMHHRQSQRRLARPAPREAGVRPGQQPEPPEPPSQQ